MKMGDLELSLDDIIKKKLKKTGPVHNRNNAGKKPIRRIADPKNRITKNQNAGLNNKMRSAQNRGQGAQLNIGDARLKIIQKQRQKITDAREKLGQISKQTDARLRLVKLRERQRGQRGMVPGGRIPGRIISEMPLQRTVQPRMNNSYYEDKFMDYTNDVSYLNRNFAERSIIDDDLYSYQARTEAPVLYRTVENDLPIIRIQEQGKNVYSWTKPAISIKMTNIPVGRSNIARTDERRESLTWDMNDMPIVITKNIKPQETVGILKRGPSGNFDGQVTKIIKVSPPLTKNKPTRTLSERFCQEGSLLSEKISMLKAKIEASMKDQNKIPEPQAPIGHRIVVSNLVPSVTHEDVKELFEDIGELISSKVVRPGTAEVVYKLHKDAVKAVDVYHNRQLDGQPMKCLLVNNKSVPPMTSKQFKTGERRLGKKVVEVDLTAFKKALHKKTTS